jgi:hypothetical protein
MANWYILWPFWQIFPVSVCCTEKNLATLVSSQGRISAREKSFIGLAVSGHWTSSWTHHSFIHSFIRFSSPEIFSLQLFIKVLKNQTLFYIWFRVPGRF